MKLMAHGQSPHLVQYSYMEHEEISILLKEIQANQQSLHDDMASIVDRLSNIEAVITQLVQQSDQPTAIDEHQLYTAARSLVVETGRASTSMLQRVLRIGYSRAASLMDSLEAHGVIGPSNGSTPRTVFLDRDTLDQMNDEGVVKDKATPKDEVKS